MMEQSAIARDLEGQILNLRYRLGRRLSHGILGDVYQAHDLVQDRPCSLKLVHHSLSSTLQPQQRLAHEAVILSRLSHQNIIEGYELNWDEKGNLFLAMAPLDGVNLNHLLVEAGVLPLTLVLEILCAVGAALQYAHDLGTVHHDINPSSIFLTHAFSRSPKEAIEAIKVLNFGLARQLPSAAEGRSVDDVDARSDQRSLAVLAYQMLTGQPPPRPDAPQLAGTPFETAIVQGLKEVTPPLPSHVITAIKKALSRNKEQRFGKLQDFIAALDGSLICQRPTREIKLEDLLDEVVEELVEKPIAEVARKPKEVDAVPLLLETEQTTRRYSTRSLPVLLLESVMFESHRDALPAVPTGPVSIDSLRVASSFRGWIVFCVVLSVIAGGLSSWISYQKTVAAHRASVPQQVHIASAVEPMAAAPIVTPIVSSASVKLRHDELSSDDGARVRVKRYAAIEKDRSELPKLAPEIDDVLSNAQSSYVNGNYRAAVSTARAVQGQSPVRAWRIIGAAACYLKDASLIKDASRRLRAHDAEQRLLSYACKINGIDLSGNPLKPSS